MDGFTVGEGMISGVALRLGGTGFSVWVLFTVKDGCYLDVGVALRGFQQLSRIIESTKRRNLKNNG